LSKQYELVQGMVFTRNDQDIFKKSGRKVKNNVW